jgi:hypothetical protein
VTRTNSGRNRVRRTKSCRPHFKVAISTASLAISLPFVDPGSGQGETCNDSLMDGAGDREQKQISQKLSPGASAGFEAGARLRPASVSRPAGANGFLVWLLVVSFIGFPDPRPSIQRRPTYTVSFLGEGSLWILDFGVPSRQNPSSGPLKATLPGRVFDLKCASCGSGRRCKGIFTRPDVAHLLVRAVSCTSRTCRLSCALIFTWRAHVGHVGGPLAATQPIDRFCFFRT